jgi:hypothetical protein
MGVAHHLLMSDLHIFRATSPTVAGDAAEAGVIRGEE